MPRAGVDADALLVVVGSSGADSVRRLTVTTTGEVLEDTATPSTDTHDTHDTKEEDHATPVRPRRRR